MAEPKERRKVPRKNAASTPAPDTRAAAPRQTSEEMRRQIAEVAYFRAKQRGFEPGHELEDWIQAESEVLSRLNANP